MNNIQNPYNQAPQQMPMMPPMPPRGQWPQARTTWQQRMFGNPNVRPLTLRQDRTIPDWIIGRSVLTFFIAFVLCTIVWGYPMELRYAVISSLSVLLFFYGCYLQSRNWARINEHTFIRNVFMVGLIVRLLWVIYCYFFFNPDYYGTTFGDGADVEWYMPFGEAIAGWIRGERTDTFFQIAEAWNSDIGDYGYPIWLAVLYILSFGESDVFVPLVVKCIVGAYCAICIYHVAKRHFGEGTARMAALFVALNPNMIYWCGTMMKEVEMVYLCCLCIDLLDQSFVSDKTLSFKGLLPGIIVASALFFFRAVLAIVLFLAMFAHIVMVSNRVMTTGKKVIAGVLVGVVLLVGMGDRMMSQAEKMMNAAQSDSQKTNMEWRSNLQDSRGNKQSFAKYAGAAIFAPLIFTIPFPTFNMANENQLTQMQLSGGSYIKNIFSFFVIWVMIMMLMSGEWRRHVFIIAYTLGYLMVLVMSPFAQSGRFHMPIWPMALLFAAYGIQIAKTNKRVHKWFPIVLAIEVVACLAWNWFKLKGRGMI